jgi:hypothetical protein
MDEEQIQDPRDQVEKLFEDDNVLIVSPLTIEANSYYGKNSPWHDDGYHGTKDFERRLASGGKIYYIINKKTGEKDSFYRTQDGDTGLSKDDIDNLFKLAPTARKVLNDITGSDVFKKLRQYAKGNIDVTTLVNSDDLIYDVIQNRKSPGDSTIVLSFEEDEDLYKILDFNDDDIWFLNVIDSRTYEFTDSDRMWEDNKEGYGIFRWFNDSNTNKLREISQIVMPDREFDTNSESFMGELYRKLDEPFDSQLDRMNWAYIDEFNEKSSEYARTEITHEIETYLKSKEFTLVRKYDRLSIAISDLIYLYSITGNRYADLKTLLEIVLKPGRGENIGGWGENYYEYEGKVDTDMLNNEFETQLDKIFDTLSEDENLQGYFKLYEEITSKYKLNTWYSTPKDDNILFRIKKIDQDSLAIVVDLNLKDKSVWGKTHHFSEENFNKFLYQPELFSIFYDD